MRAVDTAIKKYDEHSFRKVDCACVRMQRGDAGFFMFFVISDGVM